MTLPRKTPLKPTKPRLPNGHRKMDNAAFEAWMNAKGYQGLLRAVLWAKRTNNR